MKSDAVETILGAIVLVIAGGFLYFALTQTDTGTPSGAYKVLAKFNRVDGITSGADVRLAGIKIGTVVDQQLDPQTYYARLDLAIRREIEIPVDSSVKIASDGLLGGSYVLIEPGGSSSMLVEGDELEYTQGAVDLFGLIGQAVTAMGSSSDK